MQRVLVIGSGGAGKSTVAQALAAATGLPLVHLDSVYWGPGWTPTPPEEWLLKVQELVAGPAWVMDGNYGGTLDVRLAAADTVVFLDVHPAVCTGRLLRRWLRHRGESRPTLPDQCPERLTAEFILWVLTYRRRRRPAILQRLRTAREAGKRVHVLRRNEAVRRFLSEVGGAG